LFPHKKNRTAPRAYSHNVIMEKHTISEAFPTEQKQLNTELNTHIITTQSKTNQVLLCDTDV